MTRKATRVARTRYEDLLDPVETPLEALTKEILAQEEAPPAPEPPPKAPKPPKPPKAPKPRRTVPKVDPELFEKTKLLVKDWPTKPRGSLYDLPDATIKRIVELHAKGLGSTRISKALREESITCAHTTVVKQLRKLGITPHPLYMAIVNPMTPQKLARILELYQQRVTIKDIARIITGEGMITATTTIRRYLRLLGL